MVELGGAEREIFSTPRQDQLELAAQQCSTRTFPTFPFVSPGRSVTKMSLSDDTLRKVTAIQ
jgi:hypothetical protein